MVKMAENAITPSETWLEVTGVWRHFGAIQALRGVDFSIGKGEIVGLVGENGAGKSTLVKIISGFDDDFAGSFKIAGKDARPHNPDNAQRMGIAIAQQELSLVPTMTVAENIFLSGPHVPILASPSRLAKIAKPFLEEVGLDDLNPLVRLDWLSLGEQHLVEVARLIARSPQLLILDEPTAALGETDSRRILAMAQRLAKRGKSVIYVSHRLDEIFQITDRVTILRDGETQAQIPTQELTVHDLVVRMLGRELAAMFPPRPPSDKRDTLLTVEELWPDNILQPVSFSIHQGEILGLAGQLGSGAGEILAAISGSHPIRSGAMVMDNNKFMPTTPRQAIKKRIGYCSSDRKRDGLFLGRPVVENLSAPALNSVSRIGMLNFTAEKKQGLTLADTFQIDRTRLPANAAVLSGGNQQKVALGKWLSIAPRLILVDEPTRGVDVGAKAEIYKNIRRLADAGNAIVMASTDLQEISNLPDRVLTFYKGMMIDELNGADISSATILKQITDPFSEILPTAH